MIFRTENGKAEDIKKKDSGRAGMTRKRLQKGKRDQALSMIAKNFDGEMTVTPCRDKNDKIVLSFVISLYQQLL